MEPWRWPPMALPGAARGLGLCIHRRRTWQRKQRESRPHTTRVASLAPLQAALLLGGTGRALARARSGGVQARVLAECLVGVDGRRGILTRASLRRGCKEREPRQRSAKDCKHLLHETSASARKHRLGGPAQALRGSLSRPRAMTGLASATYRLIVWPRRHRARETRARSSQRAA